MSAKTPARELPLLGARCPHELAHAVETIARESDRSVAATVRVALRLLVDSQKRENRDAIAT
jgi:Ribbon-helix-helix protein, copG family